MSEKMRMTLIVIVSLFALTLFGDAKAAHYHKGHDPSVWMTFGECQLFLHDEHPEVVEIICDGLDGDNDGYDMPKLVIK